MAEKLTTLQLEELRALLDLCLGSGIFVGKNSTEQFKRLIDEHAAMVKRIAELEEQAKEFGQFVGPHMTKLIVSMLDEVRTRVANVERIVGGRPVDLGNGQFFIPRDPTQPKEEGP